MPLNPLSDEKCITLDCVLQNTIELQELLEKCKACNLEVTEAIKENQAHAQLARNLKQQFFADRA